MSELPEGWTDCQLGDLLDHIQAGKSVRCDERPPEGVEPGLVKTSAVTWGRFDEVESKTLLTDEGLDPRNRIHEGDLLISRANTLELVGAPVIVHAVTKNLYLSDKVLRLDLPQILRPWALICLKSKAGRSQIESLATGNQLSMRNISQDALRSIRIPLPPEAEQKRIAQKLDALVAQVDTLKARIDAIPVLLKRFRQSVLSSSVSGRMTIDWRTRNPHPDAVRSFDSASISSAWKWSKIPDSWDVDVYGNVAKSKLGKMLDKAKNSGIPTPYLGNINVRWHSFNLEKLQGILVSAEEVRDMELHRGDVLICEGGEPGRCAVWKTDIPGIIYQKALHRARLDGRLLPDMLVFNLKSDADNKSLDQLFTGSTIKHLTGAALKRYPLRTPPLGEQTEIVRRVEQLFAFADQLEARVSAAQKRIDALAQSLLAKAFRGELVPQDPNDEPASVLLERIRAQRAVAPKPKPKRGRKAAAN